MLKVLILDDAHVIRALLKLTIESDGNQADTACSVDEAKSLATETAYDLMIVDFMLANGETGLDFLKQLPSLPKNSQTPSIMLSAEDTKKSKQAAQSLGIKAWIKKPFTPLGILKLIYTVLGQDLSQLKSLHKGYPHKNG